MNIGVSTLLHGTDHIITATEKIARRGFRRIELFCELDGFHPDDVSEGVIDRLRALACEHDLIYSIHPPCIVTNPAATDAREREKAVQDYKDTLKLASVLGVDHMVVHSGNKSGEDVADSQALDSIRDTLMEVGATAQTLGVKLMLENTGWHDLSFIKDPDGLLELLDSCPPDTGLLLDVGHAVLQGFDPTECARAWLPRLAQIHAHDNLGKTDDHLPIGRGVVDWDRLIDLLTGANWDGVFMLEVGENEDPDGALSESLRAIGADCPAALGRM